MSQGGVAEVGESNSMINLPKMMKQSKSVFASPKNQARRREISVRRLDSASLQAEKQVTGNFDGSNYALDIHLVDHSSANADEHFNGKSTIHESNEEYQLIPEKQKLPTFKVIRKVKTRADL